MLIAYGSVKGSPGATTWALAMAARWPSGGPAPLVVELDPGGGDVGSRWRLHDNPGLAGMVVADREAPLGGSDWFTQRVPLGVEVVAAPPADAAAAIIAEFSARGRGPAALRELAATRPVFADLGRLAPHSAVLSYLDKADELLLVARPQPEQLRHLRARIAVLAERCALVRLVLVGAGPYPAEEIGDYLGVAVAAVAPVDRSGAAIVNGYGRLGWGWTRRPLLAAARTLALTYAPETVEQTPRSEVDV